MSFGSGTIWEVNGSGDDTFGGGFDPGATFATDLAATSATGSSPVVTSASYNFVPGDVGAYLFVKSGTAWTPGFYRIASVASNAATLDASVGSVVLYGTNAATQFNTVAGCATTASPTAGTWGIDYSRGTTARITFTDMVINGTTNTNFTSAANPVGPNFVGNVISVTSGTGFTVQRVEVLSVSGTTATCDKSLGTLSSTGGNGKLGGALASVGLAGGLVSNVQNMVFALGSHTYAMSASANVSGGRWNAGAMVCGYSTHRVLYNTDANLPVFQSSANSMTLFSAGGQCVFSSMAVANGNSNTSVNAFADTANNFMYLFNLKATGVATAFNPFQATRTELCSAINCTSATPFTTGGYGNEFIDCVISGGGGWACTSTDNTCTRCIVTGNTGTAPDFSGFKSLLNCVSYNSTGAANAIVSCNWVNNCIIYGKVHSGNVGVTNATAGTNQRFYVLNCAFGNNTADSGTMDGQIIVGKISLTADPFTNAAGGDYSLNNTAGGGALLRAMGFPSSFLGISTNQYLDVGAAQHTDAGGGGVTHLAGRGGGLAA